MPKAKKEHKLYMTAKKEMPPHFDLQDFHSKLLF